MELHNTDTNINQRHGKACLVQGYLCRATFGIEFTLVEIAFETSLRSIKHDILFLQMSAIFFLDFAINVFLGIVLYVVLWHPISHSTANQYSIQTLSIPLSFSLTHPPSFSPLSPSHLFLTAFSLSLSPLSHSLLSLSLPFTSFSLSLSTPLSPPSLSPSPISSPSLSLSL